MADRVAAGVKAFTAQAAIFTDYALALAAYDRSADCQGVSAHLVHLAYAATVRYDTRQRYFASVEELLHKAGAEDGLCRKALDACCELLFDDRSPFPPGRVLPVLALFLLKRHWR